MYDIALIRTKANFIMKYLRFWTVIFTISLLISGQVVAVSTFSCQAMAAMKPMKPSTVNAEVAVSVDQAQHHNYHADDSVAMSLD